MLLLDDMAERLLRPNAVGGRSSGVAAWPCAETFGERLRPDWSGPLAGLGTWSPRGCSAEDVPVSHLSTTAATAMKQGVQ